QVKGAGWNSAEFSVKDIAASGKFSIDPQKITLTRVEGQVLRGTFASELEIGNWNSPEKPVRSPRDIAQRGTALLKAKGISLTELLASVGPEFRRLKELRLTGDVSSNAEVRWRGSVRDAEITSALSV